MQAVLISIRPEWCEKIINGEKTIEVRKTKPKLEPPFKCYIYCTYGRGLIERFDAIYPNMLLDLKVSASETFGNCCNGKVIGEFVCDRIFPIHVFENGAIQSWNYENMGDSCVPYDEVASYIGYGKTGNGWHISDLEVYYTPKALSEFMKPCSNEWYCESCAMFREFDDECGNKALRIKRAPQSWCYVEQES